MWKPRVFVSFFFLFFGRQEPLITYLSAELNEKYQILLVYSTLTGTDKLKDKFA